MHLDFDLNFHFTSYVLVRVPKKNQPPPTSTATTMIHLYDCLHEFLWCTHSLQAHGRETSYSVRLKNRNWERCSTAQSIEPSCTSTYVLTLSHSLLLIYYTIRCVTDNNCSLRTRIYNETECEQRRMKEKTSHNISFLFCFWFEFLRFVESKMSCSLCV